MDDALPVGGKLVIVCYLDNGHTLSVQLSECFHNYFALFAMKVPGRLIGQQQFGFPDNSPCYAHKLPLPKAVAGRALFFATMLNLSRRSAIIA